MRSYYRHRRHQRHQCRRTTRHIENENELNALYNADDAQLTGLFSLKDFVGQAVPDVHTLPPMTSECSHCKAFLFPEELHQGRICCLYGKIKLPLLDVSSEEIKALFIGSSPVASAFRTNVRAYNSAFAFTSLGAKFDRKLASSRKGAFTFCIQGTMYHRLGPIAASADRQSTPVYAQIYFQDTDLTNQVKRRHAIFNNLDENVLTIIQKAMMKYHPYAKALMTARQQWEESRFEDLSLKIIDHQDLDRRKYNQPTASEVAVLIPTDENISNRDIILTTKQGATQSISDLHPAYDCLAYPLFGPNQGYQMNIKHATGSKHVSIREYYAYRFHSRSNEFNIFLAGGRLFHQFAVDQFAKYEHAQIRYIRSNQNHLRAEVYRGLTDQIHSDIPLANRGRKVILPSSFSGSPRHMQQLFQDAMSIVTHFGKPSLFITMTCNPHWQEFQAILGPNQKVNDRPDLTARIFRQKLNELMEDLTKRGIFGRTVAYMHVIEFQKRGLPHAHILLILASDFHLNTADSINNIISAEIPNPETQRDLYDKVIHHNLHGPCGMANMDSPCMHNNECSKKYPKQFSESTSINEDCFPTYQRPHNLRTIKRKDFQFDNRWVVPYNPYLTQKYDCHINVESCASLNSIKYIYKYIYKGPDRAMIELENMDECKQYTDSRYVSASEACWRLFAFKTHNQSHSVIRLPCHLPGEQFSIFNDSTTIETAVEQNKKTKLTEFFHLCEVDSNAKKLLYREIPFSYTWQHSTKQWCKRQRQYNLQIARLYAVNPNENEKYYLRLLLNTVRGPTSYENLRTHDGIIHPTFRDTASSYGLTQDDSEWDRCLQEATINCLPCQIRHIFSMILVHCSPSNPRGLFTKYFEAMSEDLIHKYSTSTRTYTINDDKIMTYVAADIANSLLDHSKEWTDYDLPNVNFALAVEDRNNNNTNMSPIEEESNYDPELINKLASDVYKLNADQKAVYDRIKSVIENDETQQNTMFFVDGPGGHGKTFLLNAIIASFRKEHKIVLAVSSSGISSLLLCGGRTTYSRFKIPLDLTSTSTCNITKESLLGELIRQTDLIIWDEAPMSNRFAVEAVNRTIQDICDNSDSFGGKCIIFSGDFRQTLPILPNANESEIIDLCLNHSTLWNGITHMHLSQNMRLDHESRSRAEFLLAVGDGTVETHPEYGNEFIELPDDVLSSNSLNSLIRNTFGEITNTTSFSDKVILTPKNDSVRKINDIISEQYPGPTTDYYSADFVDSTDGNCANWPIEFLNTITPSGAPPHHLRLKVGMPIIILRNISPSRGLCNGTRLKILQLLPSLIEGIILNGSCTGNSVFIPRIQLNLNRARLPFTLCRRQFPVQIAFAMTINKSQGQTLKHVGIYLPLPVFSHGQLYVALSRCPNFKNLNVFIEHKPIRSHTSNIVYKEVLI